MHISCTAIILEYHSVQTIICNKLCNHSKNMYNSQIVYKHCIKGCFMIFFCLFRLFTMWVCALLYGMSQSWKTVIFFQGMEPPILLVSVVLAVDILLNYGSSASSLSKLQVCYYDKTIKLNAAEK